MWIIVGIVLALVCYLIYAFGVFKPVTVYTDQLQTPQFLYYSFKGSQKTIGDEFEKIAKAMKGHFKLSNCFGIYLSLPEEPVWKCVLGILVNPGEKLKVESFLKENQSYKSQQMPSVRYAGARLPYINVLSFLLMSIKIPKFIGQLQKLNYPIFKGVIQIYHFNFSPTTIQLVNPLNNQDVFDLYEQE